MASLRLMKVELQDAPNLDSFSDRTIYQTIPWLQFVASTQGAEPIVAVVYEGTHAVGRFTGLIVRKCGMRILGSPLPGWSTSYMGFNLLPSLSRFDALLALQTFAFHELGCSHFEVMDRRLDVEEVARRGYHYRILSGFEIDLSKEEDELFGAMTSACRRCIRKATKGGVVIEVVNDVSFVDDYYSQLQDVFAKQKLVPTYSKQRVQALVKYLLPTGQLLLLRARDREGFCTATGIFPAMNDTMSFFGGASWRSHQILRHNEALQWFAMRYWKARGIIKYDMGGGGEYKRKYGGKEIRVPWVRKSKYSILENLRNGIKNIYAFRQRIYGLSQQ